jgi:hypothetical protein
LLLTSASDRLPQLGNTLRQRLTVRFKLSDQASCFNCDDRAGIWLLNGNACTHAVAPNNACSQTLPPAENTKIDFLLRNHWLRKLQHRAISGQAPYQAVHGRGSPVKYYPASKIRSTPVAPTLFFQLKLPFRHTTRLSTSWFSNDRANLNLLTILRTTSHEEWFTLSPRKPCPSWVKNRPKPSTVLCLLFS